jgi:hypothetical protein
MSPASPPPWKFRQFAADRPNKAVTEAILAITELELGIGDTLWVAVIHPPAPLRPIANDQPSALGGDSQNAEDAADRLFGGHIQRRRYEDAG